VIAREGLCIGGICKTSWVNAYTILDGRLPEKELVGTYGHRLKDSVKSITEK
jgi:hypothetical protein